MSRPCILQRGDTLARVAEAWLGHRKLAAMLARYNGLAGPKDIAIGQAKPSTHRWGIAIDLNARSNAMGTAGDMDPALVALFEGHGFTWGGRWSGANKDPMHFQYCSGH